MRILAAILVVFLAIGVESNTHESITAQTNSPETCPALVEEALEATGEACAGVRRNSACYGNIQVDSAFTVDVPEDFFTEPSDQTVLNTLANIRTAPYSLERNEWGVAILRAQANVPNTIPGQSVVFVMLGDVEVENAVDETEAFEPGDAISLVIQGNALMRTKPATGFTRILTGIPDGSVVEADAINPAATWVRVTFDEQAGWINRNMLADDETIDDLPIIGEETFTPMQAFYMRTGLGRPTCEDAPDQFVVQGPQDLYIDLRVNGADIRFGSTGVLTLEPPGNIMRLVMTDGEAYLYPDTEDEIRLPAGSSSTICLTEDFGNLGADGDDADLTVGEGCFWTLPEVLTGDELSAYLPLENIPPAVLEYPIEIEIPEITVEACEVRDDWTAIYTVQPEDTISAIAPLYNLTVPELAEGNCLPDPNLIVVDQELIVPGGFGDAPPADPAPVGPIPPVQPLPTGVDLRLTMGANPLNVNEGDPVNFQVNLVNNGTQEATGVLVGVVPGAGLNITDATAPGTTTYDGGTNTWVVGTVPAGGSFALQFTATTLPGSGGTTITTTSSVTAQDQPDLNTGDNATGVTVTVGTVADVVVNVAPSAGPYAENGTVVFTITVNNVGGVLLNNVVTEITFDPLALALLAATPSIGTFDAATNTWTVPALDIGVTETLTLDTAIRPGAIGPKTFDTALLTSTPADTNTVNNTSTANFAVQPGPLVVNNGATGPGAVGQDAQCSLEEAIQVANTDAPLFTDIGECPQGLPDAQITFNLAGPIVFNGGGANAAIEIGSNITLTGPVTLQNGLNPGLRLLYVGPTGNLVLNDVTVDAGQGAIGGNLLVEAGTATVNGGAFTNGIGGTNGGAIAVIGGTLAINGPTAFTANATAGNGGAIFADGSTLTIDAAAFNGNNAVNGGGIYAENGGNITITITTFDTNTATTNGGGIHAAANSGTFTTTGNLFTGNTADAGGGIFNGANAAFTVTNSNFTGNTAAAGGGGIFNATAAALEMVIRNSGFSTNEATIGPGGDILNQSVAGLFIYSSTLANSTSTGGNALSTTGPATLNNVTMTSGAGGATTLDNAGPTITNNTVITGVGAGVAICTNLLGAGSANNIEFNGMATCGAANVDPGLGGLTGAAPFHYAVGGPNIINAGNNATCEGTDQLGTARPVGVACDIGAIEY